MGGLFRDLRRYFTKQESSGNLFLKMAQDEQYFKKYRKGQTSTDEAKKAHQWVLLLVDKYLRGQASPSEKSILDNYFLDGLENFSVPHHPSEESLADKQAVWEQILPFISRRKATSRVKPSLHWWYRAAAAVFVGLLGMALGAYFLWPKFSAIQQSDSTILAQHIVTNTNNDIQSVSLPDGSAITINRHSEISYDNNTFNQKGRHINLVRGEAFFEVAKNKEKPFVVHMDHLEVMVVGTSFNIKLNQQTGTKTIAVKTGKVLIKNRDKEMATLLPGDVLRYETSSDTFDVFKDNKGVANSWMNGNLVFINAGADEIGTQIESYYQIGVSITDDSILSTAKFNAAFPKETPVEKVAETIASLYRSSYKIANGKLVFYKKLE